MKQWYRMEAATDDATVVDIHIIDFIGDWIDDWFNRNFGYDLALTARAFVEELSKLPTSVKSLRVHINSPGGDVFAALNIANALRDQQLTKGRTVETIVDGLAASAASIVMMAGSTVRMADNALVMVHNPWLIAVGDSAEMRKAADELDKVRNTIVATYQWHSKMNDAALVALMDAETWMDADEAIANGFATEKVDGLRAAASLDRRGAVAKLKVPARHRARVDALLEPEPGQACGTCGSEIAWGAMCHGAQGVEGAFCTEACLNTAIAKNPKPAAPSDVLRICRESGCLDLAEALVIANATLDTVNAKVAEEKTNRAAAAQRATDIRAICAAAKQPELAEGYVAGAMTPDAVKRHLTVITAKLDRVEIDGSLPADQGGRRQAALSATAIYAERNQPTTQH